MGRLEKSSHRPLTLLFRFNLPVKSKATGIVHHSKKKFKVQSSKFGIPNADVGAPFMVVLSEA